MKYSDVNPAPLPNDQAIHIILYGLLIYLSVYCTFAPNKVAQIAFYDIKIFYYGAKIIFAP